MARDGDRPEQTKTCPLQCRLRQGGASSAETDRVDWAGLPVNLDMAFSREQRDKVYAQHQTRKRGALLRRQNGTQVCVCEIAAEYDKFSASAS
ncbi:hypothetical protein [Mycobacterium sp. 1423905.2]|uniref:hypothetical protein n=1 Tax=Mycobacterium sp. 1423905.2 TaxID=1856859 RepID=UPI0007FD0428|nr:hypothetical protein [Mycobacterium sp. 1423905.2]OBJ51643.1 hypothetical protein A9W95_21905 [Mycobacterium sp. 1423905.2]